jgi:glycolate oxidase iron-sulfur subunit
MSDTAIDLRSHLAELADQCVKCGLCVPLCPTYRVANTEAESPRGRIAFAQALASGTMAPSASMIEHLDHCLACMTCERVCPSHVRYGELIVETRYLLRSAAKKKPSRWIELLVRHPALLRLALRIADKTAVRMFTFTRMMREAPRIPEIPEFAAAKTPVASRGRVALFLGCVASIADRDVHVSARHLLKALGYDVVVPNGQGCCGALALHNGDIAGCDSVAAMTRTAFADANVETVLVSASGCFGTLRDRVFGGTKIRVREIHEFLQDDPNINRLTFKRLQHRAALHTPCTQANVARADDAVLRLLNRIPDIDITPLPTEPRCCGAAGDYFLRHPQMSDALRAQKLGQLETIEPEILVTSNVGCRVFLDNGLRQRARPIEVVHPIVLLARQLQN